MGFYEAAKEVLAAAHHRSSLGVRCVDCAHQRYGYRAVHIYAVLKILKKKSNKQLKI
jgi:hypothetical protein